MKIKDLLTKVAKAEKLTDEEQRFLNDYDPDKAVNDAAAAARRKAEQDADAAKAAKTELEQKLADLQAQIESTTTGKKSESDKAQAMMDKLTKQVADLDQKLKSADAEKAKLIRQTKLDEVIRSAGIVFSDAVDKKIMTRALADAFAEIGDDALADANAVKPIIETFRAVNKGVIVDTSGHGSGGAPHVGTQRPEVGVLTGKPIDQMTPEERQADLKKRNII